MAERTKPGARTTGAAPKKAPTFAQWSKTFLAELAITSNVTASAAKAGICKSQAYEARRIKPEFNRTWQQALCEGYDNLEMELLHRLRTGEVTGQSQKEGFVNEAAARIDALLHGTIEGEASVPPVSPIDGQSWLVGASPTGEWSGHGSKIAARQAGNWLFFEPRDGMRLLNRTNGQEIRYQSGWQAPPRPAAPSGGTTIDAEAPQRGCGHSGVSDPGRTDSRFLNCSPMTGVFAWNTISSDAGRNFGSFHGVRD